MFKILMSEKGLKHAAELEEGIDVSAGLEENFTLNLRPDEIRFLTQVFLENPDGKLANIHTVRGFESGLDHLEIITTDGEKFWKHKVYQTELRFEDLEDKNASNQS